MMTARDQHTPEELKAILSFYAEAGVDEPLEETAPDRFQLGTARAPAAATPHLIAARDAPEDGAAPDAARGSGLPPPFGRRDDIRPPAIQPAAVPDEAQAARARELASQAGSLDELRDIMAGFDGCNLKFTAKTMVFADGRPGAPLMLVGEAPGRDEDLEGLPFVGRSGQLLDRILAAIGVDRRSAYIANVIPWRPPGNRTPTPHETEICRPFIERQIELAAPKVLMTLGGPSAKTLLNTPDGIMRLRGNWKVHTTAAGVAIPTMPTLHPAYLLRNPAHKRLAWRDFLEAKLRLGSLS